MAAKELMGLTGWNMPKSYVVHLWRAHPQTGAGNITGGLAEIRKKSGRKIAKCACVLGAYQVVQRSNSQTVKTKKAQLTKRKRRKMKRISFSGGGTHWMKRKIQLDWWYVLVTFCHQDLVIRLSFKYVCVLCGLLNSEVVITVIIWCNYTVFPLCSSDFSDIILEIALCIHSARDCNVKYKLDNKSADLCGRGFTVVPSVSPSPYLPEGQAQPPMELYWRNATALGKFLAEVMYGWTTPVRGGAGDGNTGASGVWEGLSGSWWRQALLSGAAWGMWEAGIIVWF